MAVIVHKMVALEAMAKLAAEVAQAAETAATEEPTAAVVAQEDIPQDIAEVTEEPMAVVEEELDIMALAEAPEVQVVRSEGTAVLVELNTQTALLENHLAEICWILFTR